MARLPIPGSDSGQWGTILNDFLAQAHDTGGTLKADSVGSSQIQDDAVTSSHVADGALPQAKVASLTTDLAAKVSTTDTRLSNALAYFPPSGFGFTALSEVFGKGLTASSTGTGTLILVRVWLPAGNAITNVHAYVDSSGTLGGGSTNGFAVYTDAGVLVASTVSDNNLWASTGWRTSTFSSPIAAQSTGRFVYVGLLVNGYSSPPSISWLDTQADRFVSGGLGTNRRSMYNDSQASFLASFNPASYGTLNQLIPIVGLS